MSENKNIGWSTRLVSNGEKVCAGSFGGTIDMETVNRLVKAHFDVVMKPSGHPVFVDKKGREVWLYISVDPKRTEKGAAVLKAYREEQRRQFLLSEAKREKEEEEIQELVDSLGYDEAVRRLKGG